MRLTQSLCTRVGELTKKYSNLPDSYIKRAMEQVYWKTPRGLPQYLPRTIQRKKFTFTTHRPWTGQFYQQNYPGTMRSKVFIEPIKEWSFFKGDRVEILVGKDKGKQGIVAQIIQERNWVIIEGLNCQLRRIGKDKNFPGVVMKTELPLLVTNQVKLVDPADLQSTDIEWRYTEEGVKVRVSKRTGRVIPIPASAEETIDYKSKALYKEQPKDTIAKVVEKITFSPELKTFEMDIMDHMGIKEDRVPAKSYWY